MHMHDLENLSDSELYDLLFETENDITAARNEEPCLYIPGDSMTYMSAMSQYGRFENLIELRNEINEEFEKRREEKRLMMHKQKVKINTDEIFKIIASYNSSSKKTDRKIFLACEEWNKHVEEPDYHEEPDRVGMYVGNWSGQEYGDRCARIWIPHDHSEQKASAEFFIFVTDDGRRCIVRKVQ